MQKIEIDNLIYMFSKLPGLGSRSARRIVLHLLKDKETRLQNFITALSDTYHKAVQCKQCNNIDIIMPCKVCSDDKREQNIIAIVENVSDLWAMERTASFKGLYHVLGNTLSANSGNTPESLGLLHLAERIKKEAINEVIIATSSTIEGQTTAFFITDFFRNLDIKISRLASGIPVGGELDYLDEGTLTEII